MRKTLPATPKGWTRRMTLHLNFGGGKGCATFTVKDEDGNATPIMYQYDTRKGGLTGFSLPGVDGVMTWAELRARWPKWVKEQTKEKQRGR